MVLRSLTLFGFWAPSAFVHICFHPPQTPLRRSTENLQFMSGHPARLEAAKYQHHVLWEKLSYLSLLSSTAMMLDERLCSVNFLFPPCWEKMIWKWKCEVLMGFAHFTLTCFSTAIVICLVIMLVIFFTVFLQLSHYYMESGMWITSHSTFLKCCVVLHTSSVIHYPVQHKWCVCFHFGCSQEVILDWFMIKKFKLKK